MSNEDDDINKNKLMDFLMTMTKDENVDDLKRFGIGMVTLIFACSIFYIASNDPKALTEQFYYYCFFGILPVIVGLSFASNVFNGGMNITNLYFYSGIAFVFIISAYLFQKVMNSENLLYVTYLLGFLSLLVLIFGLAIVYRIFVRTVVSVRGWLGFFLKFLFLIPCLLIDLLETIFAELKIAPKMVVVLFILEILLILAYIYIQKISIKSSDSIILLDNPVFLSMTKPIGTASQLFMDINEVDNPGKLENNIRENYSISMWMYINSHPNTYVAYSKETDIFRYGYPNSKIGHPRVAYYNNTNDTNNSDKVIVYVNDAVDLSGILLDVPNQSWNQLVISYNKSVIDIFVNGNLEKSVPLSDTSRPEYTTGDIIEVGHGDNTVTGGGLHGAICNVVYHKNPMTSFQIARDYNLNRYKNPPTHK